MNNTYRRIIWLTTVLLIVGCGGGGENSGPTESYAPNELPVIVDAGPTGNAVNTPFASVTICAPNSNANCRTIDHVLIDTGSTGLRIIASALKALALPQQTDSNGNPIAECTQFASGYSWGPVKTADVKLANEQASSIPIQVIFDQEFQTVPNACSNKGAPQNTVEALGANGVLGVGVFMQDCGDTCTLPNSDPSFTDFYYVCPSNSGCTAATQATSLTLDRQVPNPVYRFANDNNGVILKLPAISPAGTASVSGKLVFGIGTQTNNGLSNANVFAVDSGGTLITSYHNVTLPQSYIDSGSNAIFFMDLDPNANRCNARIAFGFYCPSSTESQTATIQGYNGTQANVNFNVANADSLFTNNPSFTAFNNLAGQSVPGLGFIWGLPFFFGRDVFVAIEGQLTPVAYGPYIAF